MIISDRSMIISDRSHLYISDRKRDLNKQDVIKDRPGKVPVHSGSSSVVSEIAALFIENGFVYHDHGKGGSLEGMIGSRLKRGNTPEQMKRAIDAMKAETVRSGKKRDHAAYFLQVLDGIEMCDDQKGSGS